MECQTLELTVLSAKDLKKWNNTRVYVTVSISGYPLTAQTTPLSNDGGPHPRWDHDMRFTINESAAKEGNLFLVFNLRRARHIKHKDIGVVRVPIKELLAYDKSATGGNGIVSYKIRGLLGKVKAEIEFRYKFFSDVNNNTRETGGPTLAYPGVGPTGPYPYGCAGAYAPSPYGYGYPPPAQHYGGAYPYAAQPQVAAGHGPSYGQQPPKKKQHKGSKVKSKLGIGLGIAGGLIGGLLFGDEVSEAISDFVGGGVDDVAGFVGAGVSDVADLVGGGVAGVADVVGGGVADVAGVVGAGVTDVVGGGLADVADTVGGEVADVAQSAGDIANVTNVVGNLTEATTDAGIRAAANIAQPLLILSVYMLD